MTITVTLSAELSAQLQAYAQQIHLSPELVVEQVLTAALPTQKSSLPSSDTPETSTADTDDTSLAAVIAQIKATLPNPEAIEQGSKVGDQAYIQYLLDHAPTDTLTMTEWEIYWPLVEQELKDLDHTPAAEA